MTIDLPNERAYQDRLTASMDAAPRTTPPAPHSVPPAPSPPSFIGPVPVIITSVDVVKHTMTFRVVRYADARPSAGELDVVARDLDGYPEVTLGYEHYVGFVANPLPPEPDSTAVVAADPHIANNNSTILQAHQDARGAWTIIPMTMTLWVLSVELDHLVCATGLTAKPPDPGQPPAPPVPTIKVRLDYDLQQTPHDGNIVAGKRLDYETYIRRTSTDVNDEEDVETQEITKSYHLRDTATEFEGSVIDAVYEQAPLVPVTVAGVELHWVVKDNRAWAKVAATPPSSELKLATIESNADVTSEDTVAAALPVVDTTPLVHGADRTKQMRIDVGNVTAGLTRTLTMPDRDVDLGQAAIWSWPIYWDDPKVGDAWPIGAIFHVAGTLETVWGETDVGGSTVDFNIEHRPGGSAFIAGSDRMSSDLQATTSQAKQTSFSDASVAVDAQLWVVVSAVSGSPTKFTGSVQGRWG